MRIVLSVVAVALAVSTAFAFPTIRDNTPRQARNYVACDSILLPTGPSGRTRTIYLVSGTAVGTDSTLEVWRNGGARPTFRRMQATRWATTNVNGSLLILTIYRDGATSAMNRLFVQPYVWTEIPIEADSIVIKDATAGADNISFCAW